MEQEWKFKWFKNQRTHSRTLEHSPSSGRVRAREEANEKHFIAHVRVSVSMKTHRIYLSLSNELLLCRSNELDTCFSCASADSCAHATFSTLSGCWDLKVLWTLLSPSLCPSAYAVFLPRWDSDVFGHISFRQHTHKYTAESLCGSLSLSCVSFKLFFFHCYIFGFCLVAGFYHSALLAFWIVTVMQMKRNKYEYQSKYKPLSHRAAVDWFKDCINGSSTPNTIRWTFVTIIFVFGQMKWARFEWKFVKRWWSTNWEWS